MTTNKDEIWQPIAGCNEIYEVSNCSRVRSLHFDKGKILKPYVSSSGYLTVVLSKNNKKNHCMVHRLVAAAFIPNPENKVQVDHINNNRLDNRIENLQWLTASENTKKGWDQGRVLSEKQRLTFSKNGKTFQIISTWRNDQLSLEFCGNSFDLIRAFPEQALDRGNLSLVRHGKRKQHKGWTIQ